MKRLKARWLSFIGEPPIALCNSLHKQVFSAYQSAESIAGFHVIDGLSRAFLERDCGGALYFLIAPANKHIRCQRRFYAHAKGYMDNARWFFMFVPCIEWCRVSSFNRWPLHRIRKAIGLVSSAKQDASSYFYLSGPRIPPLPGPDLFTKFARRPGCAGRQSSIFDYSCFSLSKRRRGKVTPPPLFLHFALSFCLLHFDF
jgi:hypothetical protein